MTATPTTSTIAPTTATPSPLKVGAGYLTLTLPPWGVRVLAPVVPDATQGYSVYKRVR